VLAIGAIVVDEDAILFYASIRKGIIVFLMKYSNAFFSLLLEFSSENTWYI
jgi:hypothetical protein